MFSQFLHKFFKYIRFCTQGGYTNLHVATITEGALLQDKRIIITGGSDGIGLAMANTFIHQGAKVLICGRRQEKLDEAKSKINSDKLFSMQWDVSLIDSLETKLQEAIKILGGLDIFFNNAAFLAAEKKTMDFFNTTLQTNVTAPYVLCRLVGDYYKQNNKEQGGKIINTSSINANQSSTHPYFLSKSALNSLTRGYAKEFAAYNIIVNAIAPGYCASSINWRDVSRNAYDSDTANHRITTPQDVASLALFLASDMSNAIIGQVLTIDGGSTL
ncbi:MAG: SDR family oxidoreductase [Alloprevotella sp.]|nr:SDR family oxidoreductase [Alloprevotella sp.]